MKYKIILDAAKMVLVLEVKEKSMGSTVLRENLEW